MGTCPSLSFGTDCPPRPFPKITFKSLTISYITSPVGRVGFARLSASPLKCLISFLRDVVLEEIDDAPGTHSCFPNIYYQSHLNSVCMHCIPCLTVLKCY